MLQSLNYLKVAIWITLDEIKFVEKKNDVRNIFFEKTNLQHGNPETNELHW